MTTTVVGRLSTKGWAKTPPDKMRQILENYESAAFSQSTIYAGKISSWSYAQQRAIDDPDTLVKLVSDDLLKLYSNVFSNGEVDVNVEWSWIDEREVIYQLNLSVEVRIDGSVYDLNHVLRAEGE